MTKHSFLSFETEDLEAVNLFRGQARNKNSALAFDDYSVKTPYNSTDAAYIRSKITDKIRSASTTICLLGATTASSKWVTWEIEKSIELGKKLIGVKLYARTTCPVPSALIVAQAPILNWDIDAIVAEIG